MAGLKVLFIAGVASVLLVGVSSQGLQLPRLFDCPPENPFCPVWVPCNFTEVQGPTCQDCKTRVICTPVGGLVRPCLWPLRHCVDGHCRARPSEECAPPPPPPPETTTTAEPDNETTATAEPEPTTTAATESAPEEAPTDAAEQES